MRRLIALFAATSILAALIGSPVIAAPDATLGNEASQPLAAQRVADRTVCEGSVDSVLTNLTGEAADALELLQGKYGESAGFRAVVHDGTTPVVVVDPASLASWKDRLAATDTRLAPSCVDDGILTAAHEALESLDVGSGEFAAVGYDGLVDAVVITSTFTVDEVVAGVAAGLPDPGRVDAAVGSQILRIEVAEPGASPLLGRANDTSPFWGGGKTRTLFTGYYNQCTTGFYLNSTTNGTVMLTAGHCSEGQNGRAVWNGNQSAKVGTTEAAHFPDPDLALIDGSAYAARSYSWNDQTSNKAISSSAEPTTGVVYCQMGATSLRVCAAYNALDVTLEHEGGITRHLARASGPAGPGGSLGSPGDSGGGVYRELSGGTLSARGMVQAGWCTAVTCYRFDHKLSTILSTFSATVVTQ